MPDPQVVCLELLRDTGHTPRFWQCVAVPGREPGLSLDCDGELRWLSDDASFELWISADDRLVLFRRAGAPPIAVHRAGRSTDVPEEKPTFLLDQDELDLGSEQRWRVHCHGPAPAVTAPLPIGGAPGKPAPGTTPPVPPVHIRDRPPAPPPPPPPPLGLLGGSGSGGTRPAWRRVLVLAIVAALAAAAAALLVPYFL